MQTTSIKKILWFVFYSLPVVAFFVHGTETRARIISAREPQKVSPPVKVAIYKSHRGQFASAPRVPANPQKLQSGKPNVQEVKAYVRNQAVEYGVNPKLALWIVKHESQ